MARIARSALYLAPASVRPYRASISHFRQEWGIDTNRTANWTPNVPLYFVNDPCQIILNVGSNRQQYNLAIKSNNIPWLLFISVNILFRVVFPPGDETRSFQADGLDYSAIVQFSLGASLMLLLLCIVYCTFIYRFCHGIYQESYICH